MYEPATVQNAQGNSSSHPDCRFQDRSFRPTTDVRTRELVNTAFEGVGDRKWLNQKDPARLSDVK